MELLRSPTAQTTRTMSPREWWCNCFYQHHPEISAILSCKAVNSQSSQSNHATARSSSVVTQRSPSRDDIWTASQTVAPNMRTWDHSRAARNLASSILCQSTSSQGSAENQGGILLQSCKYPPPHHYHPISNF